jgi:FHS family Na+ dependent glucose MFS transporter 1
VFAVKSLGYLVGSLVAGRLYDRVPGHPVMVMASLIAVISLVVAPFMPWLWVLVAVMLILGAAEAATDVGTNTLTLWEYGERVGPYMNGLHFAFGLGAFLSPLVVAQTMMWSGGLRWSYGLLAVLLLPATLWLARVPSPQPRTAAQAAQAGPVRYALVALFVACFFFYVGAEVSYGSWIYTYANRLGLADEASAAYLTSAFWGALTAGRLLSIPLAARFRPRSIMAVNLAGCLGSVGLVMLLPNSTPVVWIGTIGVGLSMASIFPTFMNLAGRRLPLTGQITSLFFVGSSLGAMFWPWLIGQWFEPVGPSVTMLIIFVAAVLNAAAFVALLLYAPRPTTQTQTAN